MADATGADAASSPGHAPHLVHVFPSFAPGGVPLRTAAIVGAMGDAYRHTIVSLDGNFDSRGRIDPACRVAYLHPEIDKAHPLRTLATIAGTLRRLRPDLLLTYNWGSIEWAAVNRFRRRAPHIHLEDGFGPDEATGGQLPRRIRIRRVALKRTDKVVVPSETLLRIAAEQWRLDPATLLLVPNGVDCDRYAGPPDPALVPGIARTTGAVVVGTVAPLRREKNLARLVASFARVAPGRNAYLALIGGGGEREPLAALAAELGIADRVLMPGHVEAPERVFGLLDVFAMSSDTEQMPIALIQAMAAARPVVATDVGDTRAMLAAGNRPFVVPRDDDAAYDAALTRLIDDAGLRAALGPLNRARATEIYPLERMFDTWRALLAETARRPDLPA